LYEGLFPMRLPIATYGRLDFVLQVGFFVLLAAGIVAVAFALGQSEAAYAAVLPLAVGGFVASFYRDFEREIPDAPGLVLAPADGRVTDVVEVDEKEYLGERALRVGIFLSPLNVHVNRAPLAGTVEKVVHKPGKMLKAYDPRCIDENESTLLGLRSQQGVKVGVRQVTGALARRIVCAVEPGARLARGERYGMIKLGSRTELLMPLSSGFLCVVKVGDQVRAGRTVLGTVHALSSPELPEAGERRVAETTGREAKP
jgi:phosphatidylserine decarboxylase